jgi:aldehyde dehydrogenase (NAD+)
VSIAMNEPIGVMALVCDDAFPILGLVSLIGPAMATGNTTIVVPSHSYPLAATDFYSVLETSDVPDGVVNIVTGDKDALAKVLAEHDDVEAIWYFGEREGVEQVELASASNMKRTWATWHERDWLDRAMGEGRDFLRAATQVKNVWVPYGE